MATTHHTIIHLSDLHIGANGDAMRTRTLALVSHIIKTHDPLHTTVCITGDFVEGTLDPLGQHNTRAELGQAKRALMPLIDAGFGLVLTPGNHDENPQGASWVTDQLVRWYHEELQDHLMPWTRREAAPWLFRPCDGEIIIALDSMKGMRGGVGLDYARGRVGTRQLARLYALLSVIVDEEDAPRVTVIMHHNTSYDAWTNRLVDEGKLLEILEEFGVALMLEGHEHRWRKKVTGWGMLKLGSGRSTDIKRIEGKDYLIYRSITLDDSLTTTWHHVDGE